MLLHYNASEGYVVLLPNDFFVRSDYSGPTYPVTIRVRLNKRQLDALRAFSETPNNDYVLYRVTPDGVDPVPVSNLRRQRADSRLHRTYSLTPSGEAIAREYARELAGLERLGRAVDEQA